jgi:Zn-dependent peptidase ImmA (M78 family)/DNA-binding XRE family transcriptional regulator
MSNIGERLKGARARAGLSLRDLAEQVGVSAQAISKYERGLDERVIQAQIQDWLERYLGIESILNSTDQFEFPNIKRQIARLEDVEKVALDLRNAWSLGLNPIDNLIEVLEGHGIKVGMVPGTDHFDALTLWANDAFPVIVVKQGVPGDRQRLSMAHELGHIILAIPAEWEKKQIEKAAYRFAGAFLAPAPIAIHELGERRQKLDRYEIHLLKHKFGISIQAWIVRAHDLGVINDAEYQRQFVELRSSGIHREEPGDAFPPEKSDRLERLVIRALAEDVISETRAEELLGSPLSEFWEEASRQHNGFPLSV